MVSQYRIRSTGRAFARGGIPAAKRALGIKQPQPCCERALAAWYLAWRAEQNRQAERSAAESAQSVRTAESTSSGGETTR